MIQGLLVVILSPEIIQLQFSEDQMSTFPFTVRATDSEGAFSDRQFSITVRNTRVERFMAISGTDVWTSPNGTDWTIRPGQGGTQCAYGNGTWVVLATDGVKRSTDGISWTFTPLAQVPLTLENGSAGTFPAFNNTAQVTNGPMRFVAGKFIVTQVTNSNFHSYQSVDGITWNRVTIGVNVASYGTGILSGSAPELSEDNGVIFLNQPYNGLTPSAMNNMGWRSNDGGATWIPVRNVAAAGNQSSIFLTRINGLFFAVRANTQGALTYQYSVDGSNWINSSLPAGGATSEPRNVMYANGVLYMAPRRNSTSATQALTVWTSTNGINWTANNSIKIWNTGGSPHNTQFVYRNGIFLGAAMIASTSNDTSVTLASPGPGLRFSNNGTTWTQVLLRDINNTVVNVALVDLAWM